MKFKNLKVYGLAILAGVTVFIAAKAGMPKEASANIDLPAKTIETPVNSEGTPINDVPSLVNEEGVPLEAFDAVQVQPTQIVEETKEPDHYPYEIFPAVESTTDLNVRFDPSTDSMILGTVTPGFKFEKIEDVGDWDKVEYYGQFGYVHDDYTTDTYMVKGTPTRVIYSQYEVNFKDKEQGTTKTLNPYEVMFVFGEEPDRLLVYADGRLGYVENREYATLTGTYTVVDKSDQRIDLYRDNELLYSSPVVTGKDTTPTSTGFFPVWYEKHDDYLSGPDFDPVAINDFYAFNGGQGLHDAYWRYTFGDSSYHTNGSHGCVNLPMATGDIISDFFEEAQDKGETPSVLVKQ